MARKSSGTTRNRNKSQRVLNAEQRRKRTDRPEKDRRDIFADRMTKLLAQLKTEKD